MMGRENGKTLQSAIDRPTKSRVVFGGLPSRLVIVMLDATDRALIALLRENARIGHAEAALILRPAFRAPLRYLIALYIQKGMTAHAARAIDQLRLLEPDFTPARFLDDDYPVTTMRRIRLIDTITV